MAISVGYGQLQQEFGVETSVLQVVGSSPDALVTNQLGHLIADGQETTKRRVLHSILNFLFKKFRKTVRIADLLQLVYFRQDDELACDGCLVRPFITRHSRFKL